MQPTYLCYTNLPPSFSNKNPLESPMSISGLPCPSDHPHFLISSLLLHPPGLTQSWLKANLSSPVEPSSNTWASPFPGFSYLPSRNSRGEIISHQCPVCPVPPQPSPRLIRTSLFHYRSSVSPYSYCLTHNM